VSGHHAGSHRQWAEGYRRHSSLDVRLVALPPAGWRWRLIAGAEALVPLVEEATADGWRPDVLLATGTVDVAALLGLVRRRLGPDVGVVVYQHESQLVYPTPSGAPDRAAVLANLRSWLVADRVVFASEYHRSAVVEALPRFLAGLPDAGPAGVVDALSERSVVLPVGIDLPPTAVAPRPSGRRPVVLWPHRWEPDKDPEAFARTLDRLAGAGVAFDLVLAGCDPVVPSSARQAVLDRHADRVVAVGPFPVEAYRRWLRHADVVVSCARHEFFGVAVAEAVAGGCVPVLPTALAYPELLGRRWSGLCYPPGRFGSALATVLDDLPVARARCQGLAGSMARFGWPAVAPRYDALIDSR
jgi:glycosyltransferase involved in cell wall biosynthesis